MEEKYADIIKFVASMILVVVILMMLGYI